MVVVVVPTNAMMFRNARGVRDPRDIDYELTAAHMTAGVPLEVYETLTPAQQLRVVPRSMKRFLNQGG